MNDPKNNLMNDLSNERLSDLLGAVYDCAADPKGWPAALERIRAALGGAEGEAAAPVMGLLGPHIRRTVAMGDQLSHGALFNQSLAAALDCFDAAIVAIGPEARILHANAAAQAMFASGGPVRSMGGRLAASCEDNDHALQNAVARAQRGGDDGDGAGFGAPLCDPHGAPAVAHVLPLAAAGVGAQWALAPAVAIVFVSLANSASETDFHALARYFGLTAAETRVLERVAAGASIAQIGQSLNIAEATAKTHLQRIYGKTGKNSQSDLICLANSLMAPVKALKGEQRCIA
jgi:DNA-binding CsgD family transcriptional regulator